MGYKSLPLFISKTKPQSATLYYPIEQNIVYEKIFNCLTIVTQGAHSLISYAMFGMSCFRIALLQHSSSLGSIYISLATHCFCSWLTESEKLCRQVMNKILRHATINKLLKESYFLVSRLVRYLYAHYFTKTWIYERYRESVGTLMTSWKQP